MIRVANMNSTWSRTTSSWTVDFGNCYCVYSQRAVVNGGHKRGNFSTKDIKNFTSRCTTKVKKDKMFLQRNGMMELVDSHGWNHIGLWAT